MALTQISTAGVKDDAVTAGKIPADAIGSSEIAANAVGSSELADNAVDTAAIQDDAVTDAKLANSINSAIAANTAKVQTTINNNADHFILTGTGTANTINGEANLQMTGNILTFNTTANTHRIQNVATGNHYTVLEFDSNRSNAGDTLSFLDFQWNGTKVADIMSVAGSDTTNKDDGHLSFRTSPSQGSIAERMRITSSGGVGINGTPQNNIALHVKDSANTPTMQVGNDNVLTLRGGTASGDISVSYVTGAGYKPLKFFTSDTERMRLQTGGVLSVAQGIELGSGVDGTAANTLDDYEEGTWSANSLNYDYDGNVAQRGHYVKIGRMVFATYRLKFHNQTTHVGNHLRFTGLPFTSASGNPYDIGVSGTAHGYGEIATFRIYVQPGSTYAYWYTDSGSVFNNSTALNNKDIRGTIIYTASS